MRSTADHRKVGSRFLRKDLEGLLDEPRPGTSRRVSDADVEKVTAGILTTVAVEALAPNGSASPALTMTFCILAVLTTTPIPGLVTMARATRLPQGTKPPRRGGCRPALDCQRPSPFLVRVTQTRNPSQISVLRHNHPCFAEELGQH